MKKKAILTIIGAFLFTGLFAQNYPNIVNYSINSTPVNGIKIKTNLPFANQSQMPTISIKGYAYGIQSTIDLTLVYYVFDGSFVHCNISSAGNYTPKVYLARENDKVVIFIDDKVYFHRFTVSAFAQGILETPAWFQGWTTADELLGAADKITELPYRNRLGDVSIGNISLPSGYKLGVAGKAILEELKIKSPASSWPDYVFNRSYKLMPLNKVEAFIKTNGRLPEVHSAKEVAEKGIEVGANQALLLKKIEELTLYMIELKKENEELKKKVTLLDRSTVKKLNK